MPKSIIVTLMTLVFALAISVVYLSTRAGDTTTLGVASTTVDIVNAGPSIDTIRISNTAYGSNDFSSGIILSVGANKTIHVNGTITDDNGDVDIATTSLVLFRTTKGASCTPDNNNCYTVSSCTIDTAPGDDTQAAYNCTVNLAYWTDATGIGGRYQNDNWTAYVTTTDRLATATSSSMTVEVNPLLALNLPNSINYGTRALGEETSSTTNQATTITQRGNMKSDLELSGSAMNCSVLGTMPVTRQRWAATDIGYSSSTILTATATAANFYTTYRESESVELATTLYWNIGIPSTGVKGICTGTNTMSLLGVGTYEAYTMSTSGAAVFDVTTANSGAKGFNGSSFDGRYVYFVPGRTDDTTFHGIVTRYDTQATFGSTTAWSTFDVTTVNANARGFVGASFDGRYVYFVPNQSTAYHGIVTRYDTQGTFTSSGSWSTFDTTTLDAGAKGFFGASFDGRYVYLVPYNGGISGIVTRYDTQGTFTSSGSWSTFDTTTVNAGAKGFNSSSFDGRYIYFVPHFEGTVYHGIVTRYDTQGTFTSGGSWSTFDVTTVNAGAKGFVGSSFDGRYVYLVPDNNGTTRHGIVTRYDTQGTFTSGGSWSTFDTETVNANAKGFVGASFDGRYVYFVPFFNGAFHGIVTRYDTQGTFTSSGSWSTFDATTVNANAKGLRGASFDGRYIYMAPNHTGTVRHGNVLRIDTRSDQLPFTYSTEPWYYKDGF